MRILAVDTSTKSCSVAIIDDQSLLAEQIKVTKQTHAKHVMGMIDDVIELSGLKFNDLEGFAVCRGPGSFTGLRIGISTVKGLAFASGKPLVGVSSLDALAMQSANPSFLITSLLDAKRKEVYCARYRYIKGIFEKKTEEELLPPEKAIGDIHEPCIFIGNGAVIYRNLILDRLAGLAYFEPDFRNTIRASTIAYLSSERFCSGDTDNVAIFAPKYIRKSDAEIKSQHLVPSSPYRAIHSDIQ